jgi:hypothetical protein
MEDTDMKRKVVLAVFMSMALAFSAAGCGASSAGSTSATESAASETVYGKVTSVDGNSVTVTVGTMETSESGGPETFTAGSDSKTYDLSDATITKESMGGGAPGGQAPSGTDGSTDSSSDGQTPPEKPSGTGTESNTDSSSSGTDDSTDGQTPPEKPSGTGTESGTDSSSDGQTPPDMGTASGSTDGAPSAQTESASVSDISEGDILEISLDDSGNVTAVVITSSAGGFGSDAQSVDQGTAANTISEDSEVSDTSYSSTSDDENALRVDGATARRSRAISRSTASLRWT